VKPQSPSRRKSVVLLLLSPRVALPLALLAALIASPFIYRSHQLAGLPEPTDPFDVEAFRAVEVRDEDNAFVDYRAAAAALAPMSTIDRDAIDLALEEGWLAADDSVQN
jgi:hypothetical protein